MGLIGAPYYEIGIYDKYRDKPYVGVSIGKWRYSSAFYMTDTSHNSGLVQHGVFADWALAWTKRMLKKPTTAFFWFQKSR